MRERLEAVVGDHSIYAARRQKYNTGAKIPFRTSRNPLELSPSQTREVGTIGKDIANYFLAVDVLYRTDERVRAMLDTGKPEIFLTDDSRPSRYLFVRPDIIITPQGFTICEVETSPFGLALSEVLNRGYRQEGFETLVGDNVLAEHVQAQTSVKGNIVYSTKTKSYAGQMTFLADELFSGEGRNWQAHHTSEMIGQPGKDMYRGFYLAESLTDPDVATVLDSQMANGGVLLPSPTPHMEEKANLALIWDKRFEEYFKRELGQGAFDHLREVIPPTWVVGYEEFFAPGMPHGLSTSVDLATLSRARRAFVVKPSGFGTNTSWAEGVKLLHEQSAANASAILQGAAQDASGLHVIQEFRRGVKVSMTYEGENGQDIPMQARIRLTPYYSVAPGDEGRLVAIKVTGCEHTDFIHASSSSINTAVTGPNGR